MDYEKKYKTSFERARDYYKANIKLDKADENLVLEDIFPELKESEDERVRKALIEYFNEQCDMSDWNGVYGYQVVAWLEKQSEHYITCSEEQMRVLNEVLNFAANHENPYWNDYIFGTLNSLIRQLKKHKVNNLKTNNYEL